MWLNPESKYGNFKAGGHVWIFGEEPTNKTIARWNGHASFMGAERLLITFNVETGINDERGNPQNYSGVIDILLSGDVKVLEGSVHDHGPLPATGSFHARRPITKNEADIKLEAYKLFGRTKHA